jgi:hypothetical protein
LNAQNYTYSYTDPCTGNLKTIIVPINGNVTVAYYGELGSFSANDFTNGNFESWASGIFNQYGQDSPCSQIVGLGTAVNVTQSTTLNVIGILNSLSTIASLTSGATNVLGGAVGSVSNSSGDGESNNNDNNKYVSAALAMSWPFMLSAEDYIRLKNEMTPYTACEGLRLWCIVGIGFVLPTFLLT